MQERRSTDGDVWIGSFFEQLLNNRRVPGFDGFGQGGSSIPVQCADVGIVAEKQLHHFAVAFVNGAEKGRPAVVIQAIHICLMCKKHFGDHQRLLFHCRM